MPVFVILFFYSFLLEMEIAARGNAQSAWHGRLVQDFARKLGADPTAGKVATVETGDGFSCTVDVDKLHVNVAVLQMGGIRQLQAQREAAQRTEDCLSTKICTSLPYLASTSS